MTKHDKTKELGKQQSLLADEDLDRKPATDLMKMVAAKTMNKKSMKKVFTPEEIEDILAKRDDGEVLTQEEKIMLREQYRKIKRHVKEMEKGNQGRLIVMPSLMSGERFYKVFVFSALYYAYRLADRMGRSARVMNDSDRFSKMLHSASLVDIDKFIEQIKRLENPSIELTEDGVYIFTLKKPLTDDEVGQLRLIEETRREKLHNVLKPKAMDPAIFQGILMVVRQVAPKVKKLEKHDYYAIGEGMLRDLNTLIATYFDFANGILKKDEAGMELITIVDRLFAGLAILSETRVWEYGTATLIGENINEVRRLTLKQFGMKS